MPQTQGNVMVQTPERLVIKKPIEDGPDDTDIRMRCRGMRRLALDSKS